MRLPNGIRSHDTIDRIFRHLDTASLSAALHRWSAELLEFVLRYQINIDGKVLPGTAQAGKSTSGLCLVNAWVSGQDLSLGQVSRTRKNNAPENMATLRKTALQALKQVKYKQSIKSRRKIAGWDDGYLIQILQNMRF